VEKIYLSSKDDDYPHGRANALTEPKLRTGYEHLNETLQIYYMTLQGISNVIKPANPESASPAPGLVHALPTFEQKETSLPYCLTAFWRV